jgi:hypothetical protein
VAQTLTNSTWPWLESNILFSSGSPMAFTFIFVDAGADGSHAVNINKKIKAPNQGKVFDWFIF